MSRTLAVLAIAALAVAPLRAQQSTGRDTTAFIRALDLESAGRYKESIPLYRAALHTENGVSALLGLERVYSALGTTDLLLGLLDTLIASNPTEAVYRTSQLRSLQTLGREAELRRAFDQWARAVPSDPAPYREYARLLMERNHAAAADSIIGAGGRALGSIRDLETEVAEVRASLGDWVASATAWREALVQQPEYADAAAYSLTPTPIALRTSIQQVFLAAPLQAASRRTLAELDDAWGLTADGWVAIRDLPLDTTSVDVWADFAERAESNEQWPEARDALMQILRVHQSKGVAIRAATAALNADDAAAVLVVLPLAGPVGDSATFARECVPLEARALARLGRPEEAERLVAAFDVWLSPALHDELMRNLALGWVRKGDLARARSELAASGPGADSSDTAGWLALYAGDIKTARVLLRAGTDASPELTLALATIARVNADTAPILASAFLSLAVGDSATAAARFVAAAQQTPDVASLLLATAAQLRVAQRDDAGAIALWKRVVEEDGTTPEAPQADLEWGRALMRRGDAAGAVARFEHLILTYPQSALVPQARRELDLARRAIPPGALA